MHKRFLRKKDLLDMLGIGSATFERWCKDKKVPPPVQVSRIRLWDPEEIDNWIKKTKAAVA